VSAFPARYSRQELFAGIGRDGQRKIRASTAVVVGCGALGTHLAETLARAGVGTLRIVDRDFVEPSNLQRQSLFDEADAAAGLPKAVAAQRRLARVNSEVQVDAVVADLVPENAATLLGAADVVLDGTDNFEARFLVNDVCVRDGIPWVYGACVGSYGLALAVRPHETPCLRCLLEQMPAPGSGPTCDTAGVIAPIVQVVAGIQGAEALKLLSGHPEALLPGVVTVDLWQAQFEVMDFRGRAPWCPACTEGRFEYADAGAAGTAVLCGRDAVQLRPARGAARVELQALAERLRPLAEVRSNEYLVRFTAEGHEIAVFADGRAIVKGVADPAQARALYARYVGT
jgi:molybdopterin/thiamine biosynthesis adenylyltransferase